MFRLCFLPKGEIRRIAFLALSVQLAGGIQYIVQISSRQLAVVVVFVVFRHVEVYRTFAFVGIARIQNLPHELYLFDDVSRSVWLNARGQHVERLHGFVVTVEVMLHHLHRFQLFEPRFLGYLVFAFIGVVLQVPHVGDVSHVANFISQMCEVAEKHVERDRGAGMSQMGVSVHCRSAYIHAHMRSMERNEKLLLSI